jgi:anti-sigma28 factor (negative regulator of flagellin synthesis)
MIRKISASIKFDTINLKQTKKTKIKTQKISRVEEIKKAIQNGEYKIDIQQTAKAMAKALL